MSNFITNHLTRICHIPKLNYQVTVKLCMLVVIVGYLLRLPFFSKNGANSYAR